MKRIQKRSIPTDYHNFHAIRYYIMMCTQRSFWSSRYVPTEQKILCTNFVASIDTFLSAFFHTNLPILSKMIEADRVKYVVEINPVITQVSEYYHVRRLESSR